MSKAVELADMVDKRTKADFEEALIMLIKVHNYQNDRECITRELKKDYNEIVKGALELAEMRIEAEIRQMIEKVQEKFGELGIELPE